VHVCDGVLRDVEREIAAHPPERGAALLGPRGRDVVTHLVPDPDPTWHAAAFTPSRALDARVKELERELGLELKGIVHSHPAGLDAPSEGDARELAEGLRRNGHLAWYLAPIVTQGEGGAPLARHELALPSGKVSFWAAWRRAGGVEVRPEAVRTVPLLRDLEACAAALGGGEADVRVADHGDGPLLVGRLALPGLELLALTSEHHPALPPVLLATRAGGATEQLAVAWPLAVAEEERLVRAVLAALGAGAVGDAAIGTGGGAGAGDAAGAVDGAAARAEGEGAAAEAARREGAVRAGLFARSEGLVTRALEARRVLVAGCGSVGSYLAEGLARAGVGALTLLDPERVEAANLSRTVYEAGDLGRRKVEALRGRLERAAPGVKVRELPVALEALEPAELDAEVRAADLVLAATDDPAAQRGLNRFAYARGKPALFVGLYAGAQGGEVVVSVPERTPCFLCATRARHEAERAGGQVSREADYGTGRLPGEMALAADIQHVASAALKLGLALLLGEEAGASLQAALAPALAGGMPYVTLSTVPGYWFYPKIFEGVPGQGAFQSVWLTPARVEDCPVCGAAEGRVDPLDVPLKAPGRAVLAAFGE
jgi:proteasome lid subunit RPN8/RPN11